ncbi:SLAM family member 6-like [Enoplosus armatus]|uniref:SLAM family member 6-like n=1 Tax=Enoplosus armatus TaxID=215367 RepID=UPI0039965EE9
MSIFVILGLLVCIEAPGSSSVTPVFVKKGDDVLLNVTTADDLEEDAIVLWKFNKQTILVRFIPDREPTASPVYTERLEFSVKNYSVKLKNLEEADSGVYTAQAAGIQTQLILAEHNVIVQDPVSPVELTVDSVSRSSDSCNLTVTCSTQDSHINSTFRCDNQTCSQEGGQRSQVTASGASLHVYLGGNGSIICNHSNVSWIEDMKTIEHVCRDVQDNVSESLSAGISVCLVKTVVFVVGLIVMVSAVIGVHVMERLKKQK